MGNTLLASQQLHSLLVFSRIDDVLPGQRNGVADDGGWAARCHGTGQGAAKRGQYIVAPQDLNCRNKDRDEPAAGDDNLIVEILEMLIEFGKRQ